MDTSDFFSSFAGSVSICVLCSVGDGILVDLLAIGSGLASAVGGTTFAAFLGEILPIRNSVVEDLFTNVFDRFNVADEVESTDLAVEIRSIVGRWKFSISLSNVFERINEFDKDMFSIDGVIGLSMFLSNVFERANVVNESFT